MKSHKSHEPITSSLPLSETKQLMKKPHPQARLANYKDASFQEKTPSDKGFKFYKAVENCLRNNDNKEYYALGSPFVKVVDHVITQDEANHMAKGIHEKFKDSRNGHKVGNSLPNLKQFQWLAEERYTDETNVLKEVLSLKPPQGGEPKATQSDNFFKESVDMLIEEEESFGMCFKVYLCHLCESGTSYCALKLKRDEYVWCCNVCGNINNAHGNRYYIYNSLETSLTTLLCKLDFNPQVQSTEQNTSSRPSFFGGAKPSHKFQTGVFLADSNKRNMSSKTISDFYQTPYVINSRNINIKSDKFGLNSTTQLKQHLYEKPTITVVIGCEEIRVKDSPNHYCFFANLSCGFSRDPDAVKFQHRFMVIPQWKGCSGPEVKFTLDEMLAPLTDELAQLSTYGFNYHRPWMAKPVAVFTNVLNFSASSSIVESVTSNVSHLRGLTNHEGVIVPNFANLLFHEIPSGLLKLFLSLLSTSDRANIFKIFDQSAKESVKFRISKSQLMCSEDLLNLNSQLPLSKFIHASLVLSDRKIARKGFKSVPEDLFRCFQDLYLIGMGLNTSKDVDKSTTGEKVAKIEVACIDLINSHKTLRRKYSELSKILAIKDLLMFADYSYYFGTNIFANCSLESSTYFQKFHRVYDGKRDFELIHTMNRSDVVLFNMVNVRDLAYEMLKQNEELPNIFKLEAHLM
ncbi:hypothetical protein WICPIJ_001152 [Wickerhamomyces pijperi]|uniref:Uncharacterized protein n=1 Tax=Wickerhamomyces pijperi TaxID=599730 RepID=A0A9P8TR21_WICPI|nr:hypothetical protein WICPIJ_001152 [Wickerhamomyces pijperi]